MDGWNNRPFPGSYQILWSIFWNAEWDGPFCSPNTATSFCFTVLDPSVLSGVLLILLDLLLLSIWTIQFLISCLWTSISVLELLFLIMSWRCALPNVKKCFFTWCRFLFLQSWVAATSFYACSNSVFCSILLIGSGATLYVFEGFFLLVFLFCYCAVGSVSTFYFWCICSVDLLTWTCTNCFSYFLMFVECLGVEIHTYKY